MLLKLSVFTLMQQTNKSTIKKYDLSLYITIHRHVSVTSATTIRVSHKNTNNIQQLIYDQTYCIRLNFLVRYTSVNIFPCTNKEHTKFSVFICLIPVTQISILMSLTMVVKHLYLRFCL